jgi:hypothetical protein
MTTARLNPAISKSALTIQPEVRPMTEGNRLGELAERIEAYDPKLSPDNYGDELELHRHIVLATGEGSMNPPRDGLFVRSLDAAMSLVPSGMRELGYRFALEEEWWEQGKWTARFDEMGDECGNGHTILATAATPALALAAAALRARGEGTLHG